MNTLKKLFLLAIAFTFMPCVLAMAPDSSLSASDGVNAKIYTQEEFLAQLREAGAVGDKVECERLLELYSRDQVEPIIPSTQEERDQALVSAVALGHLNKARILLSHGADVNAVSQSGESALIQAARKGNDQMCALLLEKGAQVNMKDALAEIQRCLAREGKHAKVSALLIAAGPKINREEASVLLLDAVIQGNEEMCLFLIKNRADVDARGGWGKTPLLEAISRGYESVCKILIDAKADVNATFIPDWVKRETVLGWAVAWHASTARTNIDGIIRMLLSAKANIAGLDSDNKTVLFKAAECKNAWMCELMMQLTSGCAKSTLNALYALKKHGVVLGQVLYNHRDVLLLPYLKKNDVLTKKLLNENHDYAKTRPFDHLQIDCLNPVSISYEPTPKQVDALWKFKVKLQEKEWLVDAAEHAVQERGVAYAGLRGQEWLSSFLLASAARRYESVCELLVYRQHRVNARTFAALLCMNRLKAEGNEGAQFLYRYFKRLLFPHLYGDFSYISITQLLNTRDHPSFVHANGLRPYDHLRIACLDSRLLPNKAKE